MTLIEQQVKSHEQGKVKQRLPVPKIEEHVAAVFTQRLYWTGKIRTG